MFRGTSNHVLDAKGRLSVPSRFRETLKSQYDNRLFVTNLPNCLAAYPFDEWIKIEEQFSKYRFGPPEILSFKRYFLGSAVECQLDSQGRILIPVDLRREAGLVKEVRLVGMLTYFEIWNKEPLDQEFEHTKTNFNQFSSLIMDKLDQIS